MKTLRPSGPAKSILRVSTLTAAVLLLAGCGQQIDLYDYFDDDKPAASPSVNAGGAQPANALVSNSTLGATDAALANARPSSGIEKVSLKDAQGVAATVDDLPVTNFDISQRINLENALGARLSADLPTRKRILGTLVNEKVAKSKASKVNFKIPERDLNKRLDGMVKRMKLTREGLKQRLGEKGVNESTLKNQIEGSLYIRWVMSQQNSETKVEIDEAAVDAKFNEILADPRMKPVTVISLQQVELPVEKTTEAMRQQLLYARSIEARQIMKRYKGCRSIKSASKDVFNVKMGKRVDADLGKLPAELQKALRKAGTRKMIGPIPGPTGVRLIANCGTRKISPPRPSRAQVKASLRNERFEAVVQQAMAKAREDSFIDYKDPSFRP
ncbi:SurA N-terminal domain-containing protein [Anderseniella sp. Alg231-50]|uniref:SurA N-terminal domain-containing protein n=1 Tax=Anderseniella sp. Alg231-50 TaxID=1922226 RepID=UPI000D54DC9E